MVNYHQLIPYLKIKDILIITFYCITLLCSWDYSARPILETKSTIMPNRELVLHDFISDF